MKLTDEVTLSALRGFNKRPGYSQLERMRDALEAVLPHLTDDGAAADESEWADEERDFVEVALRAADAGNAGHWPTVATYLAAEVRRLRASEGATPAIDREALTGAVADELANWIDHPPTQRWGVARQVVGAILPLIAGAS